MSQFDCPSAAALDRIKMEELPISPAARVSTRIVEIGGILAELIGFKGAATSGDLFSKLAEIAPAKDGANLLYFADWVVWDIRKLYELFGRNEQKWKEIEERARSERAGEVLSNATLHVPRTNVDSRLRRLAHIFANGLESGDLEPESTDDMMRAAVELSGWDVLVLANMYETQGRIVTYGYSSHKWSEQIGVIWENWHRIFGIAEGQHLRLRSALSRLQSAGFIAEIQTSFVKDGTLARQPFGLLEDGVRFFERIQEIGEG